ncbi:GNAT family N-acetyltransferase [Nisaea acidiphila]|uniref:GNAT family N-acetyltransferase n=1 Tax=Nisaea acidiphila TaxID=1862145 RepID=A0A9J7ATS6_9PROT|nr:GNAT family N-acetyltransferase [Nisaea acidiphila]UUX50711.1 GNAT family N-acetyltransferase [Nisaea acidiphila]
MTDISLDPVRMTDLDAIMDLVAGVSWPHRREDVAQFMRLGGGRLARDGTDGRPLAAGLYWTFGDELARIGLVIVAPECQGRGIGRKLVEQLLADVAPRPVVLLATEAGQPLYERLGFTTFDRSRQYQGTFTGQRADDPRIAPASCSDLGRIAEFDANAFGAVRRKTLEDLASAGHAVMMTEDGRLTGYAISRAFGRGNAIGPIVAGSEADAIALFRALARPGFVRVDCPEDATSLVAHLTGAGLADVGGSPVMSLGPWTPPAGQLRVYGLASHALG